MYSDVNLSLNDSWLALVNVFDGDEVWIVDSCDFKIKALEDNVFGFEGIFWSLLAFIAVITLGVVSQSLVITLDLIIPWLMFVSFM